MNNIIELSVDDISAVSGGGNSGDHEHCWNSVKNDALHGAIASGYAGMIAGGISGIPGGVPGVARVAQGLSQPAADGHRA